MKQPTYNLIFRLGLISIFFFLFFSCSEKADYNAINKAILSDSRIEELLLSEKSNLRNIRYEYSNSHPNYIHTLINLAYIYEYKNDTKMASYYYFRAFFEAKSSEDIDKNTYSEIVNEYSQFCESHNLQSELLTLLKHKVMILKDTNTNSDEIDKIIMDIAHLYVMDGDFEKASTFYQARVKILSEYYGLQNEHLLTPIYDLALNYYKLKNYPLCRKTIDAASQLIKTFNIKDNIAVKTYILAAKEARIQKEILKSKSLYIQADKLLEKKDGKLQEIILYGIAENEFILRNYNEAESLCLKSIKLSNTLYGTSSKVTKIRLKLLKDIYDFSEQYHKMMEIQKLLNP